MELCFDLPGARNALGFGSDEYEDAGGIRQWLQGVEDSTESLSKDEDVAIYPRPTTPSIPSLQASNEDLTPTKTSITDPSTFADLISPNTKGVSQSPASSFSNTSTRADSTHCRPCLGQRPSDFDDASSYSAQTSHDEYVSTNLSNSHQDHDHDHEKEVTCYPNSSTPAPLHKSGAVRVVWITSCLHCVLANLTCSRTLPSCTRCLRNGRLCLPQRRKLYTEFVHGDSAGNVLPVPLQLPGDDEETVIKKLELTEDMTSQWVEQQEKKNWVLPIQPVQGGKMGGWPRFGLGLKAVDSRHPGDGRGKVTHLNVKMD